MNGLAHVALHVALCAPIARLKEQSTFAMLVRVSDRIDRALVYRTFPLERGYENEAVVEFDVPQGLYRLQVSVSKYGCNASDFVMFMPDHDRTVRERLQARSYGETLPTLLISGTTPAAFSYAQPVLVAVDRNAPCNKPIGDTIPLNAGIENDQDAYYARLYAEKENAAFDSQYLVLKVRTAAAQYHYVRVPATFPIPRRSWPDAYGLNIPEDFIDYLATQPVDTLLCPKFSRTSVS